MTTPSITNGEAGSSVRATLNISLANTSIHTDVLPVAGGQAAATQLDYGFSSVLDSGSSSDGVQLPPALAGTLVYLFPYGNHNTQVLVWAKNGTSDSINGQSNNTAFDALTVNYRPTTFICAVDGQWQTNAVVD